MNSLIKDFLNKYVVMTSHDEAFDDLAAILIAYGSTLSPFHKDINEPDLDSTELKVILREALDCLECGDRPEKLIHQKLCKSKELKALHKLLQKPRKSINLSNCL